MAICPKRLLEYASAQSGSAQEVEVRAGISRAYYSAYHSLHPIAKQVPSVGSPNNNGYISASEILACLRGWNVAQWPSLHSHRPVAGRIERTFRALRDERVQADYFLDIDCHASTLKESIGRATEIGRAATQLATAIGKAQEAQQR